MSLLSASVRYDLFWGVAYYNYFYASTRYRNERLYALLKNTSLELFNSVEPRSYCDKGPNNCKKGMIEVEQCRPVSNGELVRYDEVDLFSIKESSCKENQPICEHYNVPLRSVDNETIDHIIVAGYEITRGFIPQDDCASGSSLFIEPDYFLRLQDLKYIDETSLIRLSLVNLAELHERGCLDFISSVPFGDASPDQKTGKLIHCRPRHYVGQLDFYGRANKIPRYCCKKCKFSPCYCAECKEWLDRCPQCGSWLLDGIERLKDDEELTRDEARYWSNSDIEAPILQWDFDKLQWKITNILPLRGEYWNFQHIFETLLYTNSEDYGGVLYPGFNFICSGKLARYIVEEQSGPLTLIPIPVDVSGCTSEQLEALESIAYQRPEAVPPVLKETT